MSVTIRDGDEFPSHYEDRTQRRFARGALPAAGIWLAGARYEVAAYGSPAEARLVRAGAIHLAGVRFDGRPCAAASGGAARPLHPGELHPLSPRRAAAGAVASAS